MILRCPTCGTTASFETWGNQDVQGCLKLFSEFPKPTPHSAAHYLTLFRPAKTVLTWKKASKVLKELLELIKNGTIAIEGENEIPCYPSTWAKAMDQMVSQETKIKRPLKNHNYLRKVAYGLAENLDRKSDQLPGEKHLMEQAEEKGFREQGKSIDLPEHRPEYEEFWSACLSKIKDKMLPENFKTWMEPTHCLQATEKEVMLAVPNNFYVKCLSENFITEIQDATQEVDGKRREVRFRVIPIGGM